ncbi:unnamed protein product [Closterium sp. Yama58-4]|nr:unnamed protein product [Closterium sp. Yama58-4]
MIAFAQTCLAREGSDEAAAQEALRVVEHGATMLRAQGGHAAASQAARLLRFKAAVHLRVAPRLLRLKAALHLRVQHGCSAWRQAALHLRVYVWFFGIGCCRVLPSLVSTFSLSHARAPYPPPRTPCSSPHSHDSSGAVEALEEVAAMGDAGLCDRAPPGLAFLRFRVLCSVGLVEQLCGHIATAREHFQEADELEPPDCNSVPTTGLARLAMALHLHSVGQWEQATSYYSHLIQCSTPPPPPSSTPSPHTSSTSAPSSAPSSPSSAPSSPSSAPSSPSSAPSAPSSAPSAPSSAPSSLSTSPESSPTASFLLPSLHIEAAVRVGALSGLGQLLLLQGDFKAAEEQFTAALREAEAIDDSSEFNPMMGAVLSLLGDTYAQRGRLQHTGEGMIAEGLFRRALALLGASQWDNLDHRLSLLAGAAGGSSADQDADEEQLKDRKNRVLQLDLIAFTLERYAAALQAFPMRASEAQSMSAAAHHLWRSPLSLNSAITSSRVSAAALEPMTNPTVCASVADSTSASPGSAPANDSVSAAHFLLPAPVVDVTTGRVLLS